MRSIGNILYEMVHDTEPYKSYLEVVTMLPKFDNISDGEFNIAILTILCNLLLKLCKRLSCCKGAMLGLKHSRKSMIYRMMNLDFSCYLFV